MPTFDVDWTTIPAFAVDETYLVTHDFEDEELFGELSEYYNGETYRFEVPSEEYDAVQDLLGEFYYELERVEDLAAYCVVKAQYTQHAAILKRSVENWTRDGHHFFVMQDCQAVDVAVEQGATPLSETEFVLGL